MLKDGTQRVGREGSQTGDTFTRSIVWSPDFTKTATETVSGNT